MKMKNIILCVFAFFLTISLNAQGKIREGIEEKIRSMKIAFITDRLNLTPEESQKFWPIYNQLDAERADIVAEKKADFSKDATEKEAQTFLTRHFELQEKEIQLEKKYVEKLKTAIPLRKVAKLFWVEKKFRQEIMTNIVNKRKRQE